MGRLITAIRDDVAAVAGVRVGTIAETIPSACVAATKFTAPANVWLGIAGMETEWVE